MWTSLWTRKPKGLKQGRQKNMLKLYMFYRDEPFC